MRTRNVSEHMLVLALCLVVCVMLWATEISNYLQTVWGNKLDIKFHTNPFPAPLSVPNNRCQIRYNILLLWMESNNCALKINQLLKLLCYLNFEFARKLSSVGRATAPPSPHLLYLCIYGMCQLLPFVTFFCFWNEHITQLAAAWNIPLH